MFWKKKINSADSHLEYLNKSALKEIKALWKKNKSALKSALKIWKRYENMKALWKYTSAQKL
jgi:hypothetical protein